MLSPLQQAVDLIQKSKNILIALPETLNGDSLGGALALAAAFKTLDKKTDIVSRDPVPEKLKFLAGSEDLKNKPSAWRDFIISIDASGDKISRLRYEKENNLLKIFLTSNQEIREHDIKLEGGAFHYDLAITIDAPDLESLGAVFSDDTSLFFSKPILNIDHKAANEYFGEVNLVETTAAACAEIIAGLIEGLGPSLMTPASATALLTGLIDKTRSFQNSKTTPQALSLASLLVTRGGEQEKIIEHLYKTTPLNQLRLWGRLLSRLEFDPRKETAWLSAKAEDFSTTQTSSKDLNFIIEEIDDLLPHIRLSFVSWIDENGAVWLLAKAKQPESLQKIYLELGGTLKHDKYLIRLAGIDMAAAKEKINQLIA